MGEPLRWAAAEIDSAAIVRNVGTLRALADGAEVWAVVKADGYGHGAIDVARAALAGGATRLCVALVQEAVELRAAGIGAPILVLTQQPVDQLGAALAAGAELTVYDPAYVAEVARQAVSADKAAAVHLHLDTGMSRVGADPERAAELAALIDGTEGVRLAGLMTHLACADDPLEPGTDTQLDRFDAAIAQLDRHGIAPPHLHAANSAATMIHPRARYTAVRPGIAIYGIAPSDDLDEAARALRPALTLRSRVSFVKRVDAGARVSYGWRHRCPIETTLATVPVGYADGVPRRLGSGDKGQPGFDVLIGGARYPIVGVVTMDQLVVDVGDAEVSVGDEVVLLGAQGSETIGPNDWANHLGTIGYEIVCGISKRVPRTHR